MMCWGDAIQFQQLDVSYVLLSREIVRLFGIVSGMSMGCDDEIALARARAANEKDVAMVKRLHALAGWIDKRERETSYR